MIITNSEIINYYLDKDYIDKSNILNRLSIHIDKLYEDYVITSEIKKRLNTLINDTINNLNQHYNEYSELCSNDENIYEVNTDTNNLNKIKIMHTKNMIFNKDNNNIFSTIKSATDYINFLRKYDKVDEFTTNLHIIKYDKIDEEIKKISNLVGLSNLDDIIDIYNLHLTLEKIEGHNKYTIETLKEYFIPISVNYVNKNDKNDKILSFTFCNDNDSEIKYYMLLDNVYELKIHDISNNKTLNIIGYLKNDAVNSYIRTSQIKNKYLYDKKYLMIETINTIQNINKYFKNTYIKSLSIGDLLTLDNTLMKKRY